MSSKRAGYVLNVPPNRRDLLLSAAGLVDSYLFSRQYYPSTHIAEPVPTFPHGQGVPLVVFASFEDRKLTHVAGGKKGLSAGTGLSRLNVQDLTPLTSPIDYEKLENGVPKRVQLYLKNSLAGGGILPPKTLDALIKQIIELDPPIGDWLNRYLARPRGALARLGKRGKENLAFQKEAVGLALRISGISRDELFTWRPPRDSQRSFLEGLPSVRVREDGMLLTDFLRMPGFKTIKEIEHSSVKIFESEHYPTTRLTVIMASRFPLELQTGTDLIYYNQTYRSFIMVQYKAMEQGTHQKEFRWQPGDQFIQEIGRMEKIIKKLSTIPSSNDPDSFRFSENPFFLKFCPRVIFNPDDGGLFKGIYLPLDLWKLAHNAGRFKGPRGGNVLTFENVGRRINNTEFIKLVSGSWVGTSIKQSKILLVPLIRHIISSGRTVAFAAGDTISEGDPEKNGSSDLDENEDN